MGVWSKFSSKVKDVCSKPDVKNRVDVMENVLYGKMSAADYDGLQALAQLVTALCNNKCEAVSDGGVYIFYKIKKDDDNFQVFHKRLTIEERNLLNKRPTLLRNPRALLENVEAGLALDSRHAEKFRQIADGSCVRGVITPTGAA